MWRGQGKVEFYGHRHDLQHCFGVEEALCCELKRNVRSSVDLWQISRFFFFVAFVKGKNMGKCAYIAEVCFNI